MSKLTMIYDGQEAEGLNREELITAILNECHVECIEEVRRAMREAFRCGFGVGEDYEKRMNKRK